MKSTYYYLDTKYRDKYGTITNTGCIYTHTLLLVIDTRNVHKYLTRYIHAKTSIS